MYIFAVGALLAGGLWWYFEVYRSAEYAFSAIPLWEEFDATGEAPELGGATLTNDRDYAGALSVLRKRRAVIEDILARLLFLQPSGALTHTHEDFRFLLEGHLAATTDAEKKAKFLANAIDLRSLMKGSGGGSSGGAKSVSDIARLLERQIPETRGIGGEIFTKGLSWLFPGIPFDKLFSSWQEAAPALNIILELARNFDPNLPVSQFSKLLQSSSKQTELDRINRFLEQAESAARTNTANDILAYRSFEGAGGETKEGLDLRAKRLRAAMEELRKKYPPKSLSQ